jgi:putative transposase
MFRNNTIDKNELSTKKLIIQSEYSLEDLHKILGISKQAIHKRASKEGWQYREVTVRGGRQKLYSFASLPNDVKQKIIHHIIEKMQNITPSQIAEIPTLHIPPEEIAKPETSRKITAIRLILSKPPELKTEDYFQMIANALNLHKNTLWKWWKAFKEGTLFKPRKSYGIQLPGITKKLRAWQEELAAFAISLLLSNPRKRRSDLKRLYLEVQKKANELGVSCPSYASFTRLEKWLADDLKLLRDKGRDGFLNIATPPVRRDRRAYHPFELLVGDQHHWDYYAVVPETGEVVSLEVFAWADMRSLTTFPAVAVRHYNRYTVGLALINAVRSVGLPKTVQTDWGKPERSKYVAGLIKRLSGLGVKVMDAGGDVAGEEVIEHKLAQVRRARAKVIESIFSHIDKSLRGLPGCHRRDAQDTWEAGELSKRLKKELKSGEIPTLEEAIEEIFRAFAEWNNHVFVNSQIPQDNGKSPVQVLLEELPSAPIVSLTEESAEWALLPRTERPLKPRADRTLRFKCPFTKVERVIFCKEVRERFSGREKFYVVFDPLDFSRVWVLDEKERLVGVGEDLRLVNPKNQTEVSEMIKLQMRCYRKVKEVMDKYVKEFKQKEGKKGKIIRLKRFDKQAKEAILKAQKMVKEVSRERKREALEEVAKILGI